MAQEETKRRDLLKLIGLGGVAVAAPLVANQAKALESDDEKKKSRYKETDHVRAYYRTNRY